MPQDDTGTRLYRRLLVILIMIMAATVAGVGGWLAWQGRGFQAVLALLVLGWLILVIYGYRQEEQAGRDPGSENGG